MHTQINLTPSRGTEVLCQLPGARLGAKRLAHMGFAVTRIDIGHGGAGCTVSAHASGERAAPDLQALFDCCAWLHEQGYMALSAEWRDGKNPRVLIAEPDFRGVELDAAVVASESLLGGTTRITWCARRFGVEIRWEEIV